jgi:adenine-specific DNA-methyltransferase
MQKKGKLELTWVDKYDEEKPVEPRILLEDPEKSYGDPGSENMLIHGDNLIALQALQQDFAGKIKCIYIDPPFNTGQAFENYDDNLEMSIWLNLMRRRLQLLHSLLRDDGTLFVHIDDSYLPYLTILLDEIFGRSNRLYLVTFKQGSATGHKAINPGMVTTTNFVLVYSKVKAEWNPNRIFTDRGGRDKRYGNYIENIEDNYENWRITTLTEAFASSLQVSVKEARAIIKNEPQKIDEFVRDHCESVIQLVNPDYKSVGATTREFIDKSNAEPDRIFVQKRDGLSDIILIRGKRIIFYKNKLKKIDGRYVTGEPLTTLWDDLLSNNLHNEGGVDFPKGKKPEALIKRCFEIATNEGDWVLDSFLGSGTTAAVAHKMNRRWIGIEMGNQAYTHCKKRLDAVIDDTDTSGISKAVNWQGGGGYHFYELAPSLLVKNDKLPVYQINPTYTFEMLCEAICKIEGFKYRPQDVFHGHSSEKRFIHVTTEFVNAEYIRSLSQHLDEGQSLLIYATKIQSDMMLPDNIEVKKIPKDLLDKCNFESEVR